MGVQEIALLWLAMFAIVVEMWVRTLKRPPTPADDDWSNNDDR